MPLKYGEDSEPKEFDANDHIQPPCNTKMSDDEEDEIQFENFNTKHLEN